MYELIILSLLVGKPIYGYSISKVINNIIGPFARISNGRLYPLLMKLEETGLIAVQTDASDDPGSGRTPRHQYVITEAGRARFHLLMLDTTSNPGDYRRIFMYKVSALHFLPPAEQLHIIDHYISFCQAHLHFQEATADIWRAEARSVSAANDAAATAIAKHLHEQWQLERDWAATLRADIVAAQTDNTGA